ncbi:protein kinase 5 [Chrysochromulina tobinii]|uniref:non-specific serine/threonine protein kinase n=1 Tax=Chrysochromulina tobinii TaxID=1460289 RepID=A0A0M0JTE1_9EUKA|nr:protein kinase 5 [Chrysochromulina tobinii]|eukprot:KOO29557.1 protein kinase 5 [Chrysochromulina sp. CCMP291]
MLELGSEEERRAAELEVATLAKLDHPSVVAYHEHFLYEDAAAGQSLCLVMAYCEGGDLARLIKTHAEKVPMAYFGEPQILTWFVQMSMALHYVHSKGILHRDLKSQNIFLSHGHAKLGDFGIVKVLDGSVTSAHTVIGTPYYLSPEVCKAQKYSYMSDVWSLGCVLYELCALQQAWTGNNLLAVVYKIVQASHP